MSDDKIVEFPDSNNPLVTGYVDNDFEVSLEHYEGHKFIKLTYDDDDLVFHISLAPAVISAISNMYLDHKD